MKNSIAELIEVIDKAPRYQPIPIEPETDDIYLQRYLHHRNSQCKRQLDDRIPYFEPMTGKSVLDLGCNVGMIGFLFAKQLKQYIGLDNDKACIDVGNALAKYRNAPLSFVCTKDLSSCLEYLLASENYRCDICFYLSLHHHIIAEQGWEYSREVLQLISKVSPVMYFDMGQKDEPNNPSRANWHNLLPDRPSEEFITDEILCYSQYKHAETLGVSNVAGRTGRLLFRFNR